MTAGSPAPDRVDRTNPARRRAALVLGVVLLLGSTAACSNTAPSAAAPPAALPATSAPATSAPATSVATTAAPATSAPTTAGATVVVIKNFLFAPATITVPAGAVVTVDNQDGANHTVTANDGSFDTGNIAGNAKGTFTAPSKPGTYPYKCAIHPFMTGTLTVT